MFFAAPAPTRAARIIGAFMTHRFHAGQSVRLARGPAYRASAPGEYKIIRPLPDSGSGPQYRVKSAREMHERVVNESDLERII